ncbi:MAG: hypothetical protein LBE34_12935 [Flavobacteriaceae bacterium]|nr:hypothetical protein [Flavobacteriaceae bacterium]
MTAIAKIVLTLKLLIGYSMGIVIGLFLLMVFSVVLPTIGTTGYMLWKRKIGGKEIGLGLLVSLILFLLTSLSYLLQKEAWVFGYLFRYPLIMIVVPSLFYPYFLKSKKPILNYWSTLLAISISLTGILGVVFYEPFSHIMEFLQIKTHH